MKEVMMETMARASAPSSPRKRSFAISMNIGMPPTTKTAIKNACWTCSGRAVQEAGRIAAAMPAAENKTIHALLFFKSDFQSMLQAYHESDVDRKKPFSPQAIICVTPDFDILKSS